MINEKETPVILPDDYNYMAVFLTLACQLHCSYCINHHQSPAMQRKTRPGREWIAAINRITPRADLPLTLQGGEPTLHPDFFDLVNGIREDLAIDLLTNLQFDIDEFMKRIPPGRLRRDAPYASIRVSYHPGQTDPERVFADVLRMQNKGYSIGIWAVMHPDHVTEITRLMEQGRRQGIDFRAKEFLGWHGGKLHGHMRWPDSVTDHVTHPFVQCRTTELLIDPEGNQYRCHADLYKKRGAVGSFLAPDWVLEDVFRPCHCYGTCNPCDVKVKTNRFQQYGHTSVEIRF